MTSYEFIRISFFLNRESLAERNHIEGKSGQAKNSYGLTDIRARRKDTSEAWLGAIWMAMNIKRYISLPPAVGLMAIIQLMNAFLSPFGTQITAWGEDTAAQMNEMKIYLI